MRSMLLVLGASFTISVACAGAPEHQHVVQRALIAPDRLACSGYLVWDNEPVRDVFLVLNGSGILSNAFVNPMFEEALASRNLAYSTFDKPGVTAPFGDPAAVQRDGRTLERYTLGHGVACASEALHWAREQFGANVKLHLRGHSEGALVALYTYDALLDTDPELGRTIQTLLLSGLAVEPLADILEHQLAIIPKGQQLRRALADCDWDVLETSLGVSCAYVEDAKRRPSGRQLFERLAARNAAARFVVFQGTADWNTPVAPVRQLESWNARAGHLALEFHYYDGGHLGDDAVRKEMAQLINRLVSK